jgi:hypothetical protein
MSGVFKRKRKRNGRLRSSLSYYTRIDGELINLKVSDKQTAEILRANLLRERAQEKAGLLPSKAAREAQDKLTS